VWDACLTETEPDPSGGAIAVEVSMSGERFAAVRAWTVDGVCHVAVIASTESQSQLWDTVAGHYRDVATLAITPPLDIHLPDTLRRKAKIVGMRELARWVPLVRNMIAAGQVTHHPSMLLDEHVARAVATTTAGLSTAHSSGEISLARCLVWAVTLATRPTTPRRPAIAAATV
jgi:hypothetical protein